MNEVTSVSRELVKKYNCPVPRYTSYPTVPFWNDQMDVKKWEQQFSATFEVENHTRGISVYIHLPFCESLCTYCGCNKKITDNHSVEQTYLAAIETEWKLYREKMPQTPVIREIHLGGGTPTFFSPANLQQLVKSITAKSIIHPQHEFSIEGHPNNTTREHLLALYALGFRRISYGVQDNDAEVQRLINRYQPFENVQRATAEAREAGFTSINFDLVYGLPAQTEQSIESTMSQVVTLHPDRIAFYSYAHTPWVNKGQRLFDETSLPATDKKLALYLKGKELLLQNGYADIGMDHFSLPGDSLYKAWKNGKLHRNFMGYTTHNTGLLLGLGVSAISDIGTAFAQNHKTLHDYYGCVNHQSLPVRKGYYLSEEDCSIKKNILEISCRGNTLFTKEQLPLLEEFTFPLLQGLAADGLLEYNSLGLKVSGLGHYFIRNICSAFDMYLHKNDRAGSSTAFSKAI